MAMPMMYWFLTTFIQYFGVFLVNCGVVYFAFVFFRRFTQL